MAREAAMPYFRFPKYDGLEWKLLLSLLLGVSEHSEAPLAKYWYPDHQSLLYSETCPRKFPHTSLGSVQAACAPLRLTLTDLLFTKYGTEDMVVGTIVVKDMLLLIHVVGKS